MSILHCVCELLEEKLKKEINEQKCNQIQKRPLYNF